MRAKVRFWFLNDGALARGSSFDLTMMKNRGLLSDALAFGSDLFYLSSIFAF